MQLLPPMFICTLSDSNWHPIHDIIIFRSISNSQMVGVGVDLVRRVLAIVKA